VPIVVRLLRYRRVPRFQRAVSRKGILLRDCGACQYCGAVLPANAMTMDHVVPKSQGGLATWDNLVACCFSCNNRKGGRTPAEAGMNLARQPRPISIHAKHQLLQADESVWQRYMFWRA
jgi:5-methylcytosine-specific restriction endonuclease McrA